MDSSFRLCLSKRTNCSDQIQRIQVRQIADITLFFFTGLTVISAVSGRGTNGRGKRVVGLVSGVEGDLPGNDYEDYTAGAQRRSVRQHTKLNWEQITQNASMVLVSVLLYVC